MEPAYTYTATVLRHVDGDTLDLSVDVGFHITVADRFRLYGVDTPERGQPGYHEATAHNERVAPAGSTVTVHTLKAGDKYGRWLAVLFLPDGSTLNQRIMDEGLGVRYLGGTKTPAQPTITTPNEGPARD